MITVISACEPLNTTTLPPLCALRWEHAPFQESLAAAHGRSPCPGKRFGGSGCPAPCARLRAGPAALLLLGKGKAAWEWELLTAAGLWFGNGVSDCWELHDGLLGQNWLGGRRSEQSGNTWWNVTLELSEPGSEPGGPLGLPEMFPGHRAMGSQAAGLSGTKGLMLPRGSRLVILE